jgi:hypothetical protein
MADLQAETRIVRIGSTTYMGLRGTADEVRIEAQIEKALRAGREVIEDGVTRYISWGMYADDFADKWLTHVWNAKGTKVQGTLVEWRTVKLWGCPDGYTTSTRLGKKFKAFKAAWAKDSDVPGKFD